MVDGSWLHWQIIINQYDLGLDIYRMKERIGHMYYLYCLVNGVSGKWVPMPIMEHWLCIERRNRLSIAFNLHTILYTTLDTKVSFQFVWCTLKPAERSHKNKINWTIYASLHDEDVTSYIALFFNKFSKWIKDNSLTNKRNKQVPSFVLNFNLFIVYLFFVHDFTSLFFLLFNRTGSHQNKTIYWHLLMRRDDVQLLPRWLTA